MVRIVLCVLCLVSLALPASAQWDPAPLPGYMDPFQPRQQEEESFYDRHMRQNRERIEREHQQFQRDYRNQRERNQVRETNCMYGRDHANKCL